MNRLAASLHGRILRAFVLIVVLAVVLGVGVGYYVTQSQVDGFVEQLVAVEAGQRGGQLEPHIPLRWRLGDGGPSAG